LSDHDAKAALVALAASGAMVVKQAGGRGRGRRVIYTLERTLVSRVDFAKALATLDGDHGAVALLAHLVEFAGADGRAPVSVLGMSEARGGPFARWTRCKLEKARVKLETTGLLVRDDDLRRGIRRPRAMFLVRAASVLKIPQNVPVDIHPPRPLALTALTA